VVLVDAQYWGLEKVETDVVTVIGVVVTAGQKKVLE
jgi:hypothetical protein